jgi:flagellar biosynthesis/type III secretory pathway protein FliH
LGTSKVISGISIKINKMDSDCPKAAYPRYKHGKILSHPTVITESNNLMPPRASGVNLLIINQIVEERLKESEEMHQLEKNQVYEEALSQGEARGIEKGHQAIEKIEKLLIKISKESDAHSQVFFNEIEKGIKSLALEMAGTIIGEAAAESSSAILEQNLKRCLSVLKGSGKTKIRINPVDYDFMREKANLFDSGMKDRYIFEFEPDPSIAPGGCYLESSHGAVDGRLESQFELLKDSLLELS